MSVPLDKLRVNWWMFLNALPVPEVYHVEVVGHLDVRVDRGADAAVAKTEQK